MSYQWVEEWDKIMQPLYQHTLFLGVKADTKWYEIPVVSDEEVEAIHNCENMYFCPYEFKGDRRLTHKACEAEWLHADLDAVDPSTISPFPTIAWETSPGRYQCLWYLRKRISPELHRKLNRALNYMVGADKNGWSITKMLRIPGSVSTKYDTSFEVNLLWDDGPNYDWKTVWSLVKEFLQEERSLADLPKLPRELPPTSDLKRGKKFTPRTKQLLEANTASVGERSDKLWELQRRLLEEGYEPIEVLALVRETVWNKYAGQRRELTQLWKEINKEWSHHTSKSNGKPKQVDYRRRVLISSTDFLKQDLPQELWMVDGIWSREAHGLIAGEPKSYKSLIATDLGVSVASGTPFLNTFAVPRTGPVILVQEENTPAMMKDRLEKIESSRGLMGSARRTGPTSLEYKPPTDIPFHLMNNAGFNLVDEADREWLEKMVDKIKPALVILDPIYLMVPGLDENSSSSIVEPLRWLMVLKQKFGCGVLIVHHYRKAVVDGVNHGAARISGSSVFHRWFESALLCERGHIPGQVVITPDHRNAPPQGKIVVEFDMGDMGELHYSPDVQIKREAVADIAKRLKVMVQNSEGMTVAAASAELGVSRPRLNRVARRLGFELRDGVADGRPGKPSLRIYRGSTP